MPATGTDHNSTASARALGGLDRDRYEPPSECFQYETIKFSGRLEILDREGRLARFARHQRVRFLENGVSIFMDRVWGDRVLFANYAAQGLRIIDAIATRKGYVVLLRLPRTFSKGETLDIVTQRRIVGAFTDDEGYWESAMYAPTEKVSLEILSPQGRRFAHPDISVPSLNHVRVQHRPTALSLSVREPALNIPYRLAWSWK
jgi:hypothetical protein